MLDFTSALYLGMRHPTRTLPSWQALTSGRPATLDEPEGARSVAMALARLQGCETGTLLPSTLHLFWDLLGVLTRKPLHIFADAGLYPVARWGVQRIAAQGGHPAAARSCQGSLNTARRATTPARPAPRSSAQHELRCRRTAHEARLCAPGCSGWSNACEHSQPSAAYPSPFNACACPAAWRSLPNDSSEPSASTRSSRALAADTPLA